MFNSIQKIKSFKVLLQNLPLDLVLNNSRSILFFSANEAAFTIFINNINESPNAIVNILNQNGYKNKGKGFSYYTVKQYKNFIISALSILNNTRNKNDFNLSLLQNNSKKKKERWFYRGDLIKLTIRHIANYSTFFILKLKKIIGNSRPFNSMFNYLSKRTLELSINLGGIGIKYNLLSLNTKYKDRKYILNLINYTPYLTDKINSIFNKRIYQYEKKSC